MVTSEAPAPDSALGMRLAAGDDAALEECYAEYGQVVLAYLRRYVGPDEAEDVLQRTFLDVWRSADRYDPGRPFAGWLFTIAHRRAVDTLRARKPAVISVDLLREIVGTDGREMAESYAWSAHIRQALRTLPDVQREALELTYFEDLTQSQIARRLDVPLGTVKARVARGSRALALLLRDSGGEL